MARQLSLILLSISLFTVFSTHIVFAEQTNSPSFFSFLQNIILAYTSTALSDKQILAAHTVATPQTLQSTPTPQPAPQLPVVSAYLLQGVNDYRTSLGLSPVQASSETCAFAETRAQEISKSFTHDGFYSRVNSHTIPYTQWAHATENIAEAPDYKEVVTLWKNSPEHAANMRDNTPYVCIMQYGAYYAYEGMRL